MFSFQGNFGQVYLYKYDPQNDDTGEQVAVKELKQGSGNVKSWRKEIETLKSLCHHNIVKYKGCCTEAGTVGTQAVLECTKMTEKFFSSNSRGFIVSMFF